MLYLLKRDFLSIKKDFIQMILIAPFLLVSYQYALKISTNITAISGIFVISSLLLFGIMSHLFKEEEGNERGMLLCLGYSKKCQVICRSIYLPLIPCITSLLYAVLSVFLQLFQTITIVEFCFLFFISIIIHGLSLFMYSNKKSMTYWYLFINMVLTMMVFNIMNKISDSKYEHIQKLLFGNVYRNSAFYLFMGIIILCLYVIITIKIYESREV